MHRSQHQLTEEAVAQLTRIANALEAIGGVERSTTGPGPNEPPPEPGDG